MIKTVVLKIFLMVIVLFLLRDVFILFPSTQTTLVSAFVSYQAPTYDKYTYPVGAIAAGWLIGMMSVVPIPIFVVYKFLKASGPFIKVCNSSVHVIARVHSLYGCFPKLLPSA